MRPVKVKYKKKGIIKRFFNVVVIIKQFSNSEG